jgi:hypothetical protein
MTETPNDSSTITDGASCAVPQGEPGDTPDRGLLDGGCCSDADGPSTQGTAMSRPARRARAVAGLGFLVVAGALGSRQLPGRIALWPASLVPTWFGISHLVASVTGYEGCPELGAIPSVMLNRPIATSCGPWKRIDQRLSSSARPEPSCCA